MEPMIGESRVPAKEEVSIRRITQVNGAGDERPTHAALSTAVFALVFRNGTRADRVIPKWFGHALGFENALAPAFHF